MTGKIVTFAAGVISAGLASVTAAEDMPAFGPAMLSLGGERIVLRSTDAGRHAQER